MTGEERRKQIISLLRQSALPLSGGVLGSKTGVSRQIIVQDMALLRAEGYEIIATARGYMLDEPVQSIRVIKSCHTNEQTEEELTTIVDLGGSVIDITVEHDIYGKMTAPLNIKNRRDVQLFIKQMNTGRSTPLMNITSGYHSHIISAESEAVLDEIEQALLEKNLLAITEDGEE